MPYIMCMATESGLMNSVFTAVSLPGFAVSVMVANAIKSRATNDEILAILKEVPNPNQDDDDGLSFFIQLQAVKDIKIKYIVIC